MVDHMFPVHQVWSRWVNVVVEPKGREAGGKGDPTDHEDEHRNWKEIAPPTIDIVNNLKLDM